MESKSQFSLTTWLIIVIASIGFLFDTYELLMTPLAAPPAIAELLDVPLNHPSVTYWTGNLLWITALCGGVFGLIGGSLTDRLGRKFVMAASIFVYSLSPFLAAYSTTLAWFIFFRSTTFIGVCVEFVAAITWLAEVFEDKKQREKWLGITQAFASLGGILVTAINIWILANISDLYTFGLPLAPNGSQPASWRYLLCTGLLPAIPIALLLPFVPESRIWKERRAAGTLKRPKISALFAPEFRRVTIVTAMLSACAYGIAFGALQLTPLRIAPGLPELAEQSKALAPLRKEAAELNKAYDETKPDSSERKAIKGQLRENKLKQDPLNNEVKEV
ncbi:MAG TPA: MFS transporter, partial [Pirellula sp.]|nr:MFS transporter [Pirellula sp.]